MVAIWAFRKRSLRFRWGLSIAVAFIALIVSVLITQGAPIRASLSIWRPLDIFGTQIRILADSTNSKLILATIASLIAILLSEVVRIGQREIQLHPMKLAYTGLAIMAMLSANLLSVAMSWALIDLVRLIQGLTVAEEEREVSTLLAGVVVDWIGIFAIIGTSIANGLAGGVDDLEVPLASDWAVGLLILAVILRLGIFSLGYRISNKGETEEAFPILIGLLSPVVGLPILARQLTFGLSDGLSIGLGIGGAIGMLVAGMRWLLADEMPERRRFLIQSVAFLGIMAASLRPEHANDVIVDAVLILLMMGTLGSIWKIYAPWQRIIPFLAGLMILIPVWSPGSMIVESMAEGFEAGEHIWIPILGMIGLAMIIVGIVRDAFDELRPWYVDDLARSLYTAALMLPIVGGFGLSIGADSGMGLWSIVTSLITAGLVGIGVLSLRRVKGRWLRRIQMGFARLNEAPFLEIAGVIAQGILRVLRAIGGILEGEGAMLWIFVILLLIQLGSGLGS